MRVHLGVVVLTTLALGWATGSAAQGLGDVARQEEARRKSIGAPAKAYTNDSLKGDGSSQPATPAAATPTAPPAATPQPSGSPAATPPAATPPVADTAPRDEKYWRGRLEAARTALTRAQMFREALQTRINSLSTDFVNQDDPARRAVIGTQRQEALAEIDRLKKEIADGQKAITDIQEDARRANVPAGWVR
jgi:hypothetical protein